MTDYSSHKYYRLAFDAYRNTSHTPEKRAEYTLAWFDSVIDEFKRGGKDWAIEKFTRLYLKSLSARSRCASAFIVGPARFPVARMEKYNRWEHNATTALHDFVEKVRRPPPTPRTELDYAIEAKEYQIGEVTVKQNTEQNRLQLIFPGKPAAEMIAKLKSRGFKWSPRNTAWQRQLTPNALRVIPYLLEGNQI